MMDAVLERFCQTTPAVVLFRGLLARLFCDERLDQIFAQNKVHQFDRDLLFSELLHLLTPVVIGTHTSVHASYQQALQLPSVSHQSVYDKLRGIEDSVCAALLQQPTAELNQLLQAANIQKTGPFPGYHTFILDGKRLDATEHRLKEARTTNSAPLPGTVLAMLDTRTELFVAAKCDPDAYACERKVVLPLLESLQPGAVYLADRNFCDGPLIARFVAANAHFVVRHHGRSPRWRKIKGERRKKVGKDEAGGTVYEQAVEVWLPETGWYRLRRISVRAAQPTRDGDEWLHFLSELPDEVSGRQISDGYRGRWQIETCLGYVSCALNGEINTLAYPQAHLLCFTVALLFFNVLSVIKSLLENWSEEGGVSELSYFYLALEIATTQKGMEIAVESHCWDRIAQMSVEGFIHWCQGFIRPASMRCYLKHPCGARHPPVKRSSGKKKPHFSSHRVLQQRKVKT